MSAHVITPVRRRMRRSHRILLVLLCVGIVAFVWVQRRTSRVERLVTEIHRSGGRVALGTPAWKHWWDHVRGWHGDDPTRVKLARGITQEWLRSWDDLTDLSITELEVDAQADLGPQLARLVARHPIEILWSPGATGTDEIAAALHDRPTLHVVQLRDSDLTDAGLRQLPLEQLRSLNIAGTEVTAAGLCELKRLPPIAMIVLDGRQVSSEAVALLEQNAVPYRLWLTGPDVTDATLQTLISTLGTADKPELVEMYVGRTSVTKAAVMACQRDVPTIRIGYAQDADPQPPRRGRGYSPRLWTRWFGF